ncbi:MAG: transposase [Bacteroidales bacterium]|nr:transposase [Bacteroidales bacterium]
MKRTWSLEEKISILKEAETNGVVETYRKHGIYATTCYEWKKKYSEGGESALLPGYTKRERKDVKRLEKENKRLKGNIGATNKKKGNRTEQNKLFSSPDRGQNGSLRRLKNFIMV